MRVSPVIAISAGAVIIATVVAYGLRSLNSSDEFAGFLKVANHTSAPAREAIPNSEPSPPVVATVRSEAPAFAAALDFATMNSDACAGGSHIPDYFAQQADAGEIVYQIAPSTKVHLGHAVIDKAATVAIRLPGGIIGYTCRIWFDVPQT